MNALLKLSQNEIKNCVYKIPPPPCEVFRCVFSNICKTEKLACESFCRYVSSGVSEHPNLIRAYRKEAVIDLEMKPTREKYESLFDE